MKSTILPALGLALLLSASATAGDSTDPENTGKNVRDRDGTTATAFDQSNAETDRQITANLRKALVSDDSLSTNAHNVKIVTVGGVVTLRGPVETPAEKAVIETKAKSVAGVTRIDSQIEVDTD